jgi:hypothetical protein
MDVTTAALIGLSALAVLFDFTMAFAASWKPLRPWRSMRTGPAAVNTCAPPASP